MSDFSGPAGKITNANIGEGAMWKPKKPAIKMPWSWGGTQADPARPSPGTGMSPDFDRASEFIGILRKEGPRAAYEKYGAGGINELFDAAASYGLIDPGERESIWAAFNAAPAPSGTRPSSGGVLPMPARAAAPAASGGITEAMAAKSGGWVNALENQWAAGNFIEPQQSYFKTNAEYKAAYKRWRDLH